MNCLLRKWVLSIDAPSIFRKTFRPINTDLNNFRNEHKSIERTEWSSLTFRYSSLLFVFIHPYGQPFWFEWKNIIDESTKVWGGLLYGSLFHFSFYLLSSLRTFLHVRKWNVCLCRNILFIRSHKNSSRIEVRSTSIYSQDDYVLVIRQPQNMNTCDMVENNIEKCVRLASHVHLFATFNNPNGKTERSEMSFSAWTNRNSDEVKSFSQRHKYTSESLHCKNRYTYNMHILFSL